MPIRVSETCQNISGHVKCPCMVIRRTCQFLQLATRLTEVTRRHADIDQEDVSLAGVLQGAVGSAV